MPAHKDVLSLVPGAQKIASGTYTGHMVLPHTVEVVRLLRNLGHGDEVVSPIRTQYDWAGGKPFDSQIITADMLSISRRAYVLSEMGVGKTRATLYAFDFLAREGRVKRALIVAPLSTLVSVWENEIFENFPHLTTCVLYGDKKRRLKLLKEPADCYIINHDGVGVIRAELEARTDIDCLVVDELATYRNSKSERWKKLKPLAKRATYAWGLTGSPTPNEPTDAYGQVKLLTPENVGYSFKAFKDSTMRQVSQFRWVAKDEANDIVRGVMQPSVRFTRDQCFDLPPLTYSTRDVPLDPRVEKPFAEMMQAFATEVQGEHITAANEGVKLGKLLQLSSGFIYGADGKASYIGGLERIRAVYDVLSQTEHKVIVLAPYIFQLELLNKALSKRYSVGMVHGATSDTERANIFTGFQRAATPHVLIAHPRTMAHGLTLTEAATIVWYAPIPSLELYEQANARITRAGQTKNTHVIHLVSTRVEAKVYSRLKNKAKLQGALLDLFRAA